MHPALVPPIFALCALVLGGCGASRTTAWHTALDRIERGVYHRVEVEPLWMSLRPGQALPGQADRVRIPQGRAWAEMKGELDLAVLRARQRGHEVSVR